VNVPPEAVARCHGPCQSSTRKYTAFTAGACGANVLVAVKVKVGVESTVMPSGSASMVAVSGIV
jgi:hypothetical protein